MAHADGVMGGARRLVVAVAATVVVGAAGACVAGSASSERSAEEQLCELVGASATAVLDDASAPVDAMVAEAGEPAELAAAVVFTIASVRPDDFDGLGPYEAAVDAVAERGRQRVEDGAAPPLDEVTEEVAASVRAADAALADGACED